MMTPLKPAAGLIKEKVRRSVPSILPSEGPGPAPERHGWGRSRLAGPLLGPRQQPAA